MSRITADSDMKLDSWDCRKGSFPADKKDFIKTTTTLKMTHIIDAANCLSAHWAAMAESSKKSGLPFKNKIEDWTTEAEIKILTDLMEKRDSGRIVSSMLVQQNTVYKNVFGTKFTKHVESGYDTTAKFTLAKEI
eukprot:369720-Rhodomonas_salina.1